MSVVESSKIDGIAFGHKENELSMLITDHLDWKKEYEHLMTLQEKINSYIAFIENKQYCEVYPNKTFDKFYIEIHFKYSLTDNCKKLIEQVNKQLTELRISVIAKNEQ